MFHEACIGTNQPRTELDGPSFSLLPAIANADQKVAEWLRYGVRNRDSHGARKPN